LLPATPAAAFPFHTNYTRISTCRVACHYGDTEQQLSSTLTISSGAVFNRVMLFMLKEADGIFRRMLGLPQDASSAAAGAGDAAAAGATGAAGGGRAGGVLLAEQVPKAPRWRKVRCI
jgi:nucleolar complex protein 2